MTNRLAGAASTYLLQHADNPVDWWPWSTEAFAEARERDVPVLLSIGYASCHWCHVMARESFTDPDVAARINRDFVAIKVDREERPDVDAVYMSATQALTGGGGWPMTCFLTPDGQPFYAGTYFPPRPSSGLPSFGQLLSAIGEAWAGKRADVLGSAGHIRDALQDMSSPLTHGTLGAAELAAAAVTVVGQADPVDGGFGGAPKFPPAMTIEFLLRHHERTGSESALEVASHTLDRMAAGGIHDQLAGGFARYSVDKRWHVPHFEKMLEDNALLLGVYAHHARLTGSARSAETAAGIGDFVLAELVGDDGLFTASLDAEAAGAEGSTYVWTFAELVEVLGAVDAAEAARVYGLHEGPDDQVLRRLGDPADPGRFADIRRRLLDGRSMRAQPGRDDIAVTRSNGLMIAALADAGTTLGRPEWIAAAGRTADRLLALHLDRGRWQHSSRRGQLGSGAATLADHADLAAGLLALHQATGDPGRLSVAVDVLEIAIREFAAGNGSFYDTAGDDLIVRPRDPTDGAAPSGASSIADALLTAASLTGSAALREAAEAAVSSIADLATRFPRSAGRHLSVAEALAGGPLQIAVSGPPGPDRDRLAATARRLAAGGSVFAVGEPDRPGVPLLAGRPLIAGGPAAYVCRGFVCDRPVADVDALADLLARRT